MCICPENFQKSAGHIHIKMGPDIYTGEGRYSFFSFRNTLFWDEPHQKYNKKKREKPSRTFAYFFSTYFFFQHTFPKGVAGSFAVDVRLWPDFRRELPPNERLKGWIPFLLLCLFAYEVAHIFHVVLFMRAHERVRSFTYFHGFFTPEPVFFSR